MSEATVATTPAHDMLHHLRIAGSATRVEMQERFGPECVEHLVEHGFVAPVGSLRLSLTDAGRAIHGEALQRDLEERGSRPAVTAAYERFLDLNGPVLEVCTAWQVRHSGGIPMVNDHRDPDYDRQVLDRLGRLVDQVIGVLDDLAAAHPRFDAYRHDLHAAVDRIGVGDVSYLTDPRVRSFHNVWFELHEDLLATLEMSRQGD